MTDVGDGRRKRCIKCGAVKSTASFVRDRRRKDGFFPYCAVCQKLAYRKIQRHDGPLNGKTCPLCLTLVRGHATRVYCSLYCKNRVKQLRDRFNLGPEDYRALLDDCNGRCPICDCKMSRMNIDHNHDTLEVTGIVCTRCNAGLLAYSNHNPVVAKRLHEYLSEYPVTRVLKRSILAPPASNRAPGLQSSWQRRKKKAS